MKNFFKTIESLRKTYKETLKHKEQKQIEIEGLLTVIKDNWEITWYITGLILGLFDILENKFSTKIEDVYFNSRKSSARLYYSDPKNYHKRIEDYLKYSQFKKKYSSIRFMYEKWLLADFKELRIFNSHNQRDIDQNKLPELYKIRTDRYQNDFTLDDIKDFALNSFDFINFTRLLIARNYFSENKDFMNYFLNQGSK